MNEPMSDEEKQIFVSRLYTDHVDMVRGMVNRKMRRTSFEEIEDCVQEIFVQVVNNAEKLKIHPCPKAWIIVTTKYVLQNMNRKIQRKNDQFKVMAGKLAHEPMPDVESLAIEKVLLKQVKDSQIFEKILADLSDLERSLIQLKWWDGLSDQEVADRLGMNLKAERNRAFRLKQKIYRMLDEYKNYF